MEMTLCDQLFASSKPSSLYGTNDGKEIRGIAGPAEGDPWNNCLLRLHEKYTFALY